MDTKNELFGFVFVVAFVLIVVPRSGRDQRSQRDWVKPPILTISRTA